MSETAAAVPVAIGIDKTLETISDLTSLGINAIYLAKAATRGVLGWGQILAGVVKVAGDVKELVADAPSALPELKDLDSAEMGVIGSAAYDAVKAIVMALAA